MKPEWKTADIVLVLSLSLLMLLLTVPSSVTKSYAHFDHFALYNGRGQSLGRYYANQALDPDYARPGEPASIMFSIQDKSGSDVSNIGAMIELYSGDGSQRIMLYPWKTYSSGDFEVPITFSKIGTYQIVLSVANGAINTDSQAAPRSILSSNLGCSCDRAVFNVSISEGFGTIWNSVMSISLLGPLIVLGAVLGLTYRKRRKFSGSTLAPISGQEVLKYSIMFAAIAGGIVHLSIYSMHASLRLEYSIFFLSAGSAQVVYGVAFVLMTLSPEPSINRKTLSNPSKAYYQKTMIVNLFGLIGSVILLGLYTYTIIFPAPLSPTNAPDKIELAAILAKSVEAFLVIGIIFLIWQEKREIKNRLTKTE